MLNCGVVKVFAQTCLNYNLHITVYLVVLPSIFLCVVTGRIRLKYCGNDCILIRRAF